MLHRRVLVGIIAVSEARLNQSRLVWKRVPETGVYAFACWEKDYVADLGAGHMLSLTLAAQFRIDHEGESCLYPV